jgi:hypothetical protein
VSNGFHNLNPPFFVVATRSACDSQASHARDSIIDGYCSVLDAYDAGREAIFNSIVDCRFDCRFSIRDTYLSRYINARCALI